MNTRLRFKFEDATTLVGPEVLAGNDLLIPRIDTGTLVLSLVGTNGVTVHTLSGDNVPELKKLAKSLLIERGALFNAEVRNGKLSRDTTATVEEEQVVSTMDHEVA